MPPAPPPSTPEKNCSLFPTTQRRSLIIKTCRRSGYIEQTSCNWFILEPRRSRRTPFIFRRSPGREWEYIEETWGPYKYIDLLVDFVSKTLNDRCSLSSSLRRQKTITESRRRLETCLFHFPLGWFVWSFVICIKESLSAWMLRAISASRREWKGGRLCVHHQGKSKPFRQWQWLSKGQ